MTNIPARKLVQKLMWLNLLVLIISPRNLYGQIKQFTPGDAFFCANMTEELVNSLPDEGGEIELSYRFPAKTVAQYGAFAKPIGISILKIMNVQPRQIKSLKTFYFARRKYDSKIVQMDLQENGTVKEHELNGFGLLVYNRGIDWRRQKLGLKYNENWMKTTYKAISGKVEVKKNHALYMPLFSYKKAIIHEWENATEILPLLVTLPKTVEIKFPKNKIISNEIDAGKIQFVIIPYPEELRSYYNCSEDLDFISIVGDKVIEYSFDENGYLTEKEWDPDQ